jgi:hypothetical protein
VTIDRSGLLRPAWTRISRDPLARKADPNPLFCWLLFSAWRWPMGLPLRHVRRLDQRLAGREILRAIGQDAPEVPKS